jgi:hypothetical protein
MTKAFHVLLTPGDPSAERGRQLAQMIIGSQPGREFEESVAAALKEALTAFESSSLWYTPRVC